jgi:hypothetical protein
MFHFTTRLVSFAAVLLIVGCAAPDAGTIVAVPAADEFTAACTKVEFRSALDVGGGQERLRVTRLCEAALASCQRNAESANCQRELRRYGFSK